MTDQHCPNAEPPAAIRVLIADDDHLVRAGIIGILTTANEISVVAEAVDGQEATELARSHRLDVALLDIRMPRLDGIAALRAITRDQPQLAVAMLTTFSDEHLVEAAIEGGARGFLLKSDEPQQLLNAVRALAADGGAFSPSVARWLAARALASMENREDRERVRELTPRQRELLVHVGTGASNAEIARLMDLSEGTVKQYLSAIFSALGIENRVHAAVLAYKTGLL
jgi:DNA-binding NarL/FixJ family response regulator